MVSGSLIIREACPEDDEAIGEILVNAFVQGYAEKMPEVVVHDERKRDLRDVAEKRRIGTVLVAELDGKVLGSVTLLKPGAPRSEAWLPKSADLRFLGIDLRYRGQGIADRILDHAENLARSWGCDTLSLHVRRGAHGVAGLYLKRGYRRDPSGDLDKLPMIFLEAYIFSL